MADNGMFAPLPGSGRRRQAGTTPADQWRPILPVPDDAPPGPPHHKRRSPPAGCWVYRDAAGKLLGYVLRFDLPDSGKAFLPATWCCHTATGAFDWRFKTWRAPRPLYGLDRLAQRSAASVIVTEGEKAADAAAELSRTYRWLLPAHCRRRWPRRRGPLSPTPAVRRRRRRRLNLPRCGRCPGLRLQAC